MKQDLVFTSVSVYKMCSMCTFLSKKVLFLCFAENVSTANSFETCYFVWA